MDGIGGPADGRSTVFLSPGRLLGTPSGFVAFEDLGLLTLRSRGELPTGGIVTGGIGHGRLLLLWGWHLGGSGLGGLVLGSMAGHRGRNRLGGAQRLLR